jgi:hypothetical protein
MLAEQEHQPPDGLAVLKADRAHANEPAFHELVAVLVVRQPLQLFGGDETRGF